VKLKVSILPDAAVDPWPALWEDFDRELHASKASPLTRAAYADAADLFYGFLRERNWPTDPAHLEKRHIEDFLIWLQEERQAKPATVRARFSTLRRFFNWCIEEQVIEHSPMARMHGPKIEEPPPAVLTEDEQHRLLGACKGGLFEDRRDMALLRLMLDTGIRRGEAAGIKLDDLDRKGQVVQIMGKGNRPRLVFYGAQVARDIDRYLRVRAHHPRHELAALWIAQKGPLTGDGIHHLIARRARQAGIARTVHPHLTRHSWAHAMKRGGASDEDVMTLGGWRDAKIMGRYGASAAQARAQETHRRIAPGDHI
jgi:site-specific recombinase XerD